MRIWRADSRETTSVLSVKEGPGSSSAASFSKLLREALNLDKDILIYHTHRGMGQNKHGKLWVIIAWLHYQVCLSVLRP